jgi:hypothetical protein
MDVLCIFGIDLVPSNAGKPLRFKDSRSRTVRASVADGPEPAGTVHPVFVDGPFFSGRF